MVMVMVNGLLFHMTQLISRSNTKSCCRLPKPTVSKHQSKWK